MLAQHARARVSTKLRSAELQRRQVDRDRAAVEPAALPALRAARRPRRSTQSPIGSDQAALLGERDEFAGQQQAARRMLPAQQRLGADDARRSRASSCGW